MNLTTVAVGTGAIVVAGRWANKEQVTIKVAIGVGAYAICLSMLSAADAQMANSLAFMVFFLACTYYLADDKASGRQGLVTKLFKSAGAR
jgi:uncharacterized membrane protein YfcA